LKIFFGFLNPGMSSYLKLFPAPSSPKNPNDSYFETSENVSLTVAKDLETQEQMLRFPRFAGVGAQHDTPFAWGNPR
jgi:hypothetical protein